MQENRIKAALREGRVAVGTSVAELATRGLPKMLEYAGLDWAYIDMEHSGLDMDSVANLISWFKATPITVLVRPPDTLYHFMAGLMDAGAMGIQAAHVDSAEEARMVVDAVMYPPLGKRGVGMNSAHTDYTKPKAADYMPARNAQTTIVALIESVKGLDNIDEIAAVEGLDVIEPTHNDLTLALGIPQQYEHPTYKAALRKVAEACKRHGKALKFHAGNDAEAAEMYELGCRIMAIRATTNVLQDALRSDADHLRKQVARLSGSTT